MRQPHIHVNKKPALDDLTKPNPLQLQQVETSDRGSCHQSQSHTLLMLFFKSQLPISIFSSPKELFHEKIWSW